MTENVKAKPHTLIIENREALTVSGVTEVGNFDEDIIVLYTSFGEITVKGEKLQVSLLNTETGEVSAQGKINSVQYSDKVSGHTSFWTRISK